MSAEPLVEADAVAVAVDHLQQMPAVRTLGPGAFGAAAAFQEIRGSHHVGSPPLPTAAPRPAPRRPSRPGDDRTTRRSRRAMRACSAHEDQRRVGLDQHVGIDQARQLAGRHRRARGGSDPSRSSRSRWPFSQRLIVRVLTRAAAREVLDAPASPYPQHPDRDPAVHLRKRRRHNGTKSSSLPDILSGLSDI